MGLVQIKTILLLFIFFFSLYLNFGQNLGKDLTFCALGTLTKILTRGYLTFSTKRALLNFFISLIFFLSHLYSSHFLNSASLSHLSSHSSPSLTTTTPPPPPTTTKPKSKKQKTNQNLRNPFSTKKKSKKPSCFGALDGFGRCGGLGGTDLRGGLGGFVRRWKSGRHT
jgi:hypothetical protein